MSKGYRKRRTQLKNHDKGFNRHSKGTALLGKNFRQAQERARIQRRRPMATEEEKHAERMRTQAEEARRRAQKEVNDAIQKRLDEEARKKNK